MTLLHKHGGTITKVTAIGHSTYKGVAEWFYFGTVQWDDGSGDPTKEREIPPFCLCHDDTPESRARVLELSAALNEYLGEVGEWHDMKHKRDGRCYSWTPREPDGRKEL